MTMMNAPRTNFVARKMTAAAPLSTAPVPLMRARPAQRRPWWVKQWRTRPVCARVKPTKTPMAKSGMRDWTGCCHRSRR